MEQAEYVYTPAMNVSTKLDLPIALMRFEYRINFFVIMLMIKFVQFNLPKIICNSHALQEKLVEVVTITGNRIKPDTYFISS